MSTSNWMTDAKIGNGGYHIHQQIAYHSILSEALKSDKTANHAHVGGTLDVPPSEMVQFVENLKGKCFYDDGVANRMYGWPHGVMTVEIRPKYTVLEILSFNQVLVDKVRKWGVKHLHNKREEGEVYAVAKVAADELDLVRIGVAGMPLERGNYSPNVVEDYDYIVTQFNSETPAGRVVILEGEPGTGKTFFVRGLLHSLNKSMCVTIPPGSIESLGNPDFVPMLIRSKNVGQSILLIVEDADSCLVKRSKSNMASVSALLNLGDGIFGSAFDIRILCTTNATLQELDPAILREGRLCRRSAIGPLKGTQANTVMKRLLKEAGSKKVPEKYNPKDELSLAKVYSDAIKLGWKPAPRVESTEDEETDY